MTGCDLIVRRIAFSRDLSEHGDKSRNNGAGAAFVLVGGAADGLLSVGAVAGRCIERQNAARPRSDPPIVFR